ncbi:unnamed protein product [Spirodela intermedia]|uniref:Uncharacterized protein n=2 Tax=Spirodela intermedia TaxID=51605 RepID=A0A7I8K3H5_SPIIN|nr:unnamed protein product [Spirodela intermedia]CAA6656150.1 unnamed protein product [Spirodela intermedia]CAA7391612.1 unnamed protein product [Spirodela intermedia]
MASACIRSINRTSLRSLRSSIKARAVVMPRRESLPSGSSPAAPQFSSPSSSRCSTSDRRTSFLSRCPSELGCVLASLFPLHSAVAAARLTSCLSSTSQGSKAFSQGTLCRTYPGL